MICPNCSSRNVNLYCNLSTIIFKNSYSIYSCKACLVGFTTPKLDLDLNHYEDAVRPEVVSEDLLDSIREYLRFIIQCFINKNGRAPYSLLDVGCGNGLMLSVAKELGLDVMGIEPSRGMYNEAKRKGLNVMNCCLEDFNGYHKYDLVVLNSVIEHLQTPNKTLDLLYSRVSESTLVVFQQAVFDGLLPRLFRWFWYGWSPSEHYFHYTINSFSTLVEQHGW